VLESVRAAPEMADVRSAGWTDCGGGDWDRPRRAPAGHPVRLRPARPGRQPTRNPRLFKDGAPHTELWDAVLACALGIVAGDD
jgi:hypothetical protein